MPPPTIFSFDWSEKQDGETGTRGADEREFRSCLRKLRDGSGRSDPSFRKIKKVDVLFNSISIQNDDLEIAVDRKNCHKGDLQRIAS